MKRLKAMTWLGMLCLPLLLTSCQRECGGGALVVYNATGLTWDLYLEDELVGNVWPDQTWSTGAGYRFSLRMESNCAVTGTSYTLYESGNIPECGETCIDILP